MDRRSWIVRGGRLLQRLPLHWLGSLEAPWVRRRSRGRTPRLVFLIALPRSGSTLTYQTLVHAFEPAYLSNLWNLLYGLPWTGGRLSARRCAGHRSDFRSEQGFVGGLCGPAEGLRFWAHWNGAGLDETAGVSMPDARLEARMAYLREVIAALTDRDQPMVAGYLGHTLIVDRLRAWFPEAVFVRLHRDPLSNAASILRSRQRGDGGWFSVFPRECEALRDADAHDQVAGQVYWLNRRLEPLADDSRTVHVSYEGLCRDPSGEVQRVARFCNENGMRLRVRGTLPAAFDCEVACEGESEDVDLLAQRLQHLAARHGTLTGCRSAESTDGV